MNQPLPKGERRRLEALLVYENKARAKGYQSIAGVDEAGRGPLAGPVVAAAVILPSAMLLEGVDDSKKLTRAQRQTLFEQLSQDRHVHIGVGIVDAATIDAINILQATIRAMHEAIECLAAMPDIVLVDGRPIPHDSLPIEAIISGDSKSQSIAAASVIAKETRDRIMEEYDQQWPKFGFARHKGYGTKAHIAAIREHGYSPIHRRSFRVNL